MWLGQLVLIIFTGNCIILCKKPVSVLVVTLQTTLLECHQMIAELIRDTLDCFSMRQVRL